MDFFKKSLTIAAALFLPYFLQFQAASCDASETPEAAKDSFALIELYTSQGCSSCPPADHLLNELTALADQHQQNIYTLSFHVDYWDYLGWKDPYSNSTYTHRQRSYARRYGKRNLYTPQMIVNGAHQFSGYERMTAVEEINRAMTVPAQIKVELNVRTKDSKCFIYYSLSDLPKNGTFNIAIVESGMKNYIPTGENAGLTAEHDNTVRAFESFSEFQKQGEIILDAPLGIDEKKSAIICFVQDMDTLGIIGASRAKFP